MSGHNDITGRGVDQVLAALKMYRQRHGWEAMWQMMPPGVRFLSDLLEEVDGLGPELALEVALKAVLCYTEEEGDHEKV